MIGTRRRQGPVRVTIKDVARLAAVSPSTVSLALRRPEAVSDVLRARIGTAVEVLGYVPNLMAGALAGGRPRIVGTVVPSLVNSFFADTVTAMQARLAPEGLQLLIGHSDYDEAVEEHLVRTFLAWSPAAMVVTGLRHNRATRRILEAAGVPVIEIWELGAEPIDTAIGFSHRAVGREQARHLLAAGCRTIAFIGARLGRDNRASQRAAGFREALAAERIAEPIVIDAGPEASARAAATAFRALHAERPALDGVVFSNDLLAIGAQSEARRLGLAVPGDVAMIGFGDLDFAREAEPRISSVRPPGSAIGARAADLILGAGPEAARAGAVDLGFELIVRDSSLRA